MKAVILAGGLGTRISEETHLRPKPMVEIGGRPILWHIMKIYSSYGINEFVICCGYKAHVIKDYFSNYSMYNSDLTIDLQRNAIKVHQNKAEPWSITLVDTGETTMTGGRLKRVGEYIADEEAFCFTYGDGVADLNIGRLIDFHFRHGKMATVTAVNPPGRYGALICSGDEVVRFDEKPVANDGLINGGFFVLSPRVLDYVEDDSTTWEREPLEELAKDGQLAAYKHAGFWQPMDTLREKNLLEKLWQDGNAPWRLWG